MHGCPCGHPADFLRYSVSNVWAIPKDSAKCASLLCIKLNPSQDAACGRRSDKLDKQVTDTKAAPCGGLKWPCDKDLDKWTLDKL